MKDEEDGGVGDGCVSWRKLHRLFNATQIHPSNANGSENDNEYVHVDDGGGGGGGKRIRVVHVLPKRGEFARKSDGRRSRRSVYDDYWFTQAGKPLRGKQSGPCRCSFRRSAVANNNDERAFDLENYADALIRDAIETAIEELRLKSKNVFVNLGFEAKEAGEKKRCGEHPVEERPSIVLLHGIGSSADVWRNVVEKLADKGYEAIAPDLLGHGFSSVPNKAREYSFENLLKITTKIIDHYLRDKENKKCIIVGHSFGCSLATAVFKERSQLIGQLVLISGGGPTPLVPSTSSDEEDLSSSCLLQALFEPLLFCGMKRSVLYSSRGKHFVSCESGDDKHVPKYVLKHIASGQNWPEGDSAYHRRITVPTLLVHGLQDKIVTLVQECEMERTIPRSFLELIPDAGHLVMLDCPDQLSHLIICFIEWWST